MRPDLADLIATLVREHATLEVQSRAGGWGDTILSVTVGNAHEIAAKVVELVKADLRDDHSELRRLVAEPPEGRAP
jgi:hypothetical protein